MRSPSGWNQAQDARPVPRRDALELARPEAQPVDLVEGIAGLALALEDELLPVRAE
jgi:hypothetical protein